MLVREQKGVANVICDSSTDRLQAVQQLLDNGMLCSPGDIESVLNAFDCVPNKLLLTSDLHPDLVVTTEPSASATLKCTL
jgi:hypothetical protein